MISIVFGLSVYTMFYSSKQIEKKNTLRGKFWLDLIFFSVLFFTICVDESF